MRDVLVGGHWVASRSPERVPVVDPWSNEVLRTVCAGHPDDVEAAVTAAGTAWEEWSRRSLGARADVVRRAHDHLRARAHEAAAHCTAELGVPVKTVGALQVELALQTLDGLAGVAVEFSSPERGREVRRIPYGVIACVTPWNFPLHQAALKIGSALLAGCAAVVKPSELTPSATDVLLDCFAAAVADTGAPPGIVAAVNGTGSRVGGPLVTHPGVDAVSFTGSTQTGRIVAESAGRLLRPASLELGGKSAAIVLPDADVSEAAAYVAGSFTENSGQSCSALTRLIAPVSLMADVLAEVVAAAGRLTVGDPHHPDTDLGPLISQIQLDRATGLLEAGVAAGATRHWTHETTPEGHRCLPPTVLTEVASDNPVFQREVFGPVLTVTAYRDDDLGRAVDLANATAYGLSGAVFGGDIERCRDVAERMRTGRVIVNGAPAGFAAPFGGLRDSGHGRESGRYGVEELTALQVITLP